MFLVFFFSSRRRHTRCSRDWSSDVCSSDLVTSGMWLSLAAQVGLALAWLAHVFRQRVLGFAREQHTDRKSTRLNSSHGYISYAVFCLKKKKKKKTLTTNLR